MSNITDLKLVELVDKIKKKELSSTEVTIAFIERSKKSKKLAEKLTSKAINALKTFKGKGRRLEELAHYLLDREY